MSAIHPSAIIDPAAELDSTVSVGAYSLIGPHVKIGSGTTVGPHVVIEGHTTIGRDNQIFQFTSLGAIPQDKKYAGEPCELVIGDRNTIREFCSFNIGSPGDAGVTRLGDDNWIMAYVHLAHDCQVGNHTIFANNATLAGHVHVGDWAILGGFTGVHQFVRIGAHCMTAISSVLLADLPPFVMCQGQPACRAIDELRRFASARFFGRATGRYQGDAQGFVPRGSDLAGSYFERIADLGQSSA
jgi:UDP-N-acetylglucosamine acyltransferase